MTQCLHAGVVPDRVRENKKRRCPKRGPEFDHDIAGTWALEARISTSLDTAGSTFVGTGLLGQASSRLAKPGSSPTSPVARAFVQVRALITNFMANSR